MSGASNRPEKSRVKELGFGRRCAIFFAAALIFLWGRTLRWRFDSATRAIIEDTPENYLIVLWHNQLFGAPAFFRRYRRSRKLAALISASGDGAWLSYLMRRIGIDPVRGSSHRRGPQAVRELHRVFAEGYDVAVTPDGSRGPVYVMKPGVAWLARATQANVVLLAIRPRSSIRLKSWDRFHLPIPFSVVEVELRKVTKEDLQGWEVEAIRNHLEDQLLEMRGVAK